VIVRDRTAQDYVDEIVRALPGLANDPRVIASLANQLPLLAEAAPGPLHSALEQMLEGDGAAIRPIFSEGESLVSIILAKLARIDPGGRLTNRPINSLRAIFLSWIPNTNASLSARLVALDAILENEPEIGWNLLTKLLPQGQDTSSPTAKPRFREAGASEREVVTWARVWESQREIVTRALRLAGDDAARWSAIIER
jgi:hypothetical protein